MKYLKPEMDIVEFDENILTTNDVVDSGSTNNMGGGNGYGDFGDGLGNL